MKNAKRLILVGLVITMIVCLRPIIAQSDSWSPNGFPKNYCTWYVDGQVYHNQNWRLNFSIQTGRDAWKWWDKVTNARKGQLGLRGDIMVLNKWGTTSGRYGHVAWVEKTVTSGKEWVVRHYNWDRPLAYSTTTFVKSRTGYVKVKGGRNEYPLRGFLYKP